MTKVFVVAIYGISVLLLFLNLTLRLVVKVASQNIGVIKPIVRLIKNKSEQSYYLVFQLMSLRFITYQIYYMCVC